MMFRTLMHRLFHRRRLATPDATTFLAQPFRAHLLGIHVANATATTGRRFWS